VAGARVEVVDFKLDSVRPGGFERMSEYQRSGLRTEAAPVCSRPDERDAEAARPVVGVQVLQDYLAGDLARGPLGGRQVELLILIAARAVQAAGAFLDSRPHASVRARPLPSFRIMQQLYQAAGAQDAPS
jgi:hypothetical protein